MFIERLIEYIDLKVLAKKCQSLMKVLFRKCRCLMQVVIFTFSNSKGFI